MNLLAVPTFRLPRPSWPWARAVLIALLVASASSAAFVALRHPDAEIVVIGAFYPLVIAIAFAIPAYVILRLTPSLHRGWVVPAAAFCCALPFAVSNALSDFPQWKYAVLPMATGSLTGALGGLGFWAFREVGRAARPVRVAFWISLAAVFLPIIVWAAAWRVPAPDHGSSWETANPGECVLMERAIRAMKFDQLPGHPPLMGVGKIGGPCNWAASGLSLQRVTMSEFRAAAGDDLTGRYIEHIGVSRPSYSLLRLRAVVDASHHYGPLGADGFYCTFRRGLTGWKFVSCDRAWVS